MAIESKTQYPVNGYMQGLCPKCGAWEAPITTAELETMKNPEAHHGSTRKLVDRQAHYHRLVWAEKFQCPQCNHRFAVKFSNT